MSDNFDKDLERAEQARFLLSHPMLEEAFTVLEETYTDAWKNSRHDQAAEREKIYTALNIIAAVRGHLDAVVAGGSMAEIEMKEITGKDKRFPFFN